MLMNYGPGSAGNVIAALCSVFVPGLGQLVQGRPFKALFMLVLGGLLWFFMLGWIVHIWAIWDAAVWYPKNEIRIIQVPARNHLKNESYYYMQGHSDSLM